MIIYVDCLIAPVCPNAIELGVTRRLQAAHAVATLSPFPRITYQAWHSCYV